MEPRRGHDRPGPAPRGRVISADAHTVEGVRRLERLGVTDVVVGFRWTYDRAQDTEAVPQKVDSLRRYADTVIAASR